MGGAYNNSKGNDKIYAPKIENEIKINAKKENPHSNQIQLTEK